MWRVRKVLSTTPNFKTKKALPNSLLDLTLMASLAGPLLEYSYRTFPSFFLRLICEVFAGPPPTLRPCHCSVTFLPTSHRSVQLLWLAVLARFLSTWYKSLLGEGTPKKKVPLTDCPAGKLWSISWLMAGVWRPSSLQVVPSLSTCSKLCKEAVWASQREVFLQDFYFSSRPDFPQ